MTDFKPGTFSIGRGDWRLDPKFHDFCDFLGLLERDSKGINWKANSRLQDKLKHIYYWGAWKSKSSDHSKIKEAIYDLKRSIGTTFIGNSLVEELWQKTSFDSGFRAALESFVDFQEFSKDLKAEDKTFEKDTKADKKEPAKSKPIKEVKPELKEKTEDIKIEERPRGELKQEPIDI
jgi:hypothetical protein